MSPRVCSRRRSAVIAARIALLALLGLVGIDSVIARAWPACCATWVTTSRHGSNCGPRTPGTPRPAVGKEQPLPHACLPRSIPRWDYRAHSTGSEQSSPAPSETTTARSACWPAMPLPATTAPRMNGRRLSAGSLEPTSGTRRQRTCWSSAIGSTPNRFVSRDPAACWIRLFADSAGRGTMVG